MLDDVAKEHTEGRSKIQVTLRIIKVQAVMDASEEVGNADIEQESKSEFAKYVVSQILNSHIDTNGEKNEET